MQVLDDDPRIASYDYDGRKPYIRIWVYPGVQYYGNCSSEHEAPDLSAVFDFITELGPCFCKKCKQGVVQLSLLTSNPETDQLFIEWYNAAYREYKNL